jgi:hypothetical protein
MECGHCIGRDECRGPDEIGELTSWLRFEPAP